MAKIMIVDDDRNIRELCRAILMNAGFETCEAKDGSDCLDMIWGESLDLCIIDLMMPNMDGYQLTKELRASYENMPILLLTAKSELPSKAKGFEAGADDYLTKPFEGEELVMRVKALLRRYKIESSQVIHVGKITIDKHSYLIEADGIKQSIPMKEFDLLFKLASFPGRTFSRNLLLDDIWGYSFDGNERTLDVHIGRLRERFPFEKSGLKILTVRGLGYRLETE